MISKLIQFVLSFSIGAIRDLTDSYPICIHSQTFCIFLCCLAWTIEYLLSRFSANKGDLPDEKSPTTMTTNSTITTPNNGK